MRAFEELVSEAEAADVTAWASDGSRAGRAKNVRHGGTPGSWLIGLRASGPLWTSTPAAVRWFRRRGNFHGGCASPSRGRRTRPEQAACWSRAAWRSTTEPGAPLPFPDASFELVTSRHPVRRDRCANGKPEQVEPLGAGDVVYDYDDEWGLGIRIHVAAVARLQPQHGCRSPVLDVGLETER